MRKLNLLITISIFCIAACKPNKQAKSDQGVIETIGGLPVYTKEFAYVYNKNNANAPDAYSKNSIKEYLELYTNFRLKVREAEELGLDTAESFKKELDGYKKQLAQPYLTEKGVTENLTKEAYERMKEEINASHILISVSPDADPMDTLSAYNKIIEIRQKALSGESFEKLAKEYSQDPSATSNGGNLGYFTALQMVYPFEDAAYKTKVGEISQPVRTKFGYHIIKVHNRRPSQGQVKVAHIMARATAGMTEADSIAAKQKIDEIYNRLQKGENWDQLVTQFTDDINSKSKGGELPWFSTGKMIPSFEDAAFALNNPGEISKPVLTPYGWHVIKLIEKKNLETFEELEPTLKTKVSKDSRSELNKTVLIQRLKKENNFVENPKTLETALTYADSSLLNGEWNYSADDKAKAVLFTINKDKYTIQDFFAYVKQKQRPKKNVSAKQYMRTLYKDYVDNALVTYEEAHLEEKYEDYKMLVKEYRDGILLFQLMDEKVWSKAIEDTAGLKKFFLSNNDKYKWDTRAHAAIFNVANKDILETIKKELNNPKYLIKESRFDKITFEANKHELTDQDKKKLDQIAQQILKNKDYIVEVAGKGDFKETSGISKQRIENIRDYLLSKGADSVRIVLTDLGKGAKTTEALREKDRAVSFNLYSNSKKALEAKYNENAPLTVQVQEGIYQKGDNEILEQVEWKEGTYTIEKDGRIYYIVISKIDAPRLKTFEESRGLAISDYQSYLEQEWLKQLKAKYPVVIFDEEVQKLIKSED
ncbi:MAG TPA: peptidylprolyl isomerase [Cytophagaceae bacterium]